jgi:hypothetical protein
MVTVRIHVDMATPFRATSPGDDSTRTPREDREVRVGDGAGLVSRSGTGVVAVARR